MAYAELHAHSSYSFCDGASLPDELARAAAERGYEALALTDHDNVCGAMELAQSCRELPLRPIHGAELTVNTSPRCSASRPLPGGRERATAKPSISPSWSSPLSAGATSAGC